MGNCIRQPICGDVSEPAVTTTQSQLQPQPSSSTSSSTTTSLNRNSTRFRGFLSTLNRTAIGRLLTNVSAVNRPLLVSKNNQKIRRLVLSTLKEVRTLLDNSHEPPRAILSLHVLAESEVGWLQVLQVLISTVPLSEPLGPAVILLLLEDWSLPSNESMIGLTDHILELSATFPLESSRSDCACAHLIDDLCVHQIVCTRLRNACVVLACLADKLAGPSSLQLLCQKLLQLLLSMLSIRVDPQLSLFALIALEKFAQTGN